MLVSRYSSQLAALRERQQAICRQRFTMLDRIKRESRLIRANRRFVLGSLPFVSAITDIDEPSALLYKSLN